jgi:hypothetical protein
MGEEISYRKKNMKDVNYQLEKEKKPEENKGCLSFFGKKNKVYTNDDSKHIKDDLEKAAFKHEGSDAGDDDNETEMPEMVKHLQAHHDDIDRQLISQNDMLNNLESTLKKEIDELKSLLSATTIDFLVDSNADKRLYAILSQLRADAISRGLYDSDFEVIDNRINLISRNVSSSLDLGVSKLASTVVREVVQEVINASDRDESAAG